ncbi:MAG: rRNA maturation RNase YbeY [Bdellovibrionales bacterium]|nr:rRNA maturation RNase YbeY [Bdellovibrionales bacterium]
MKVEIINLSGCRIISQTFIKKWVQIIFKELQKKKIKIYKPHLNLVFVKSAEMKKLNRTFRSKNKPTDVLSFAPSENFSSKQAELGEIVLCTSYIKNMGQGPVRERTAYAILHGILHLLGFEHEKNPQSAKKMYNIQDQIFEKYFE